MSALGQKRTLRRDYLMSALPPKADIEQWRATLPDKQRRRLRGAQRNVKL
jgi:hypothetical protein